MLKNFKGFMLALAIGATPMVMLPVQAHAQWGNFGQYNNGDQQRAYQAGYNNGVNDANKNKPLNLTTGNWKGVNLQAYQRGYETGYRSQNRTSGNYGYGNNGYGRNNGYGNNGYGWGHDRDRDRDRDRYGNQGAYSYGQYNNGDQQRAYQAGYNNGVNDRNRNKSMNLSTGKWNGINRQAYERGYEAGYRSSGRAGWYRR